MDFELRYPVGYSVENPEDDNIDLNVILTNGDVYFATAFTLKNIEKLLVKSELVHFWSTDMFIVKDLTIETIEKAVAEMITVGHLENAFSKIGTKETVYGHNWQAGFLSSERI